MASLVGKLRGKDEPSDANMTCLVPKLVSSNAGSILRKVPTTYSVTTSEGSPASSKADLRSSPSLKFAPLPEGKPKRRNSVTLGVAARASMLQGQNIPRGPPQPPPPMPGVYTVHDVMPAARKAWRRLSRSKSRTRATSPAEDEPAQETIDENTNESAVKEVDENESAIQEDDEAIPSSRLSSRRGSLDLDHHAYPSRSLRHEIVGFDYEDEMDRRGRGFGHSSRNNSYEQLGGNALQMTGIRLPPPAQATAAEGKEITNGSEPSRPTTGAAGVEKVAS